MLRKLGVTLLSGAALVLGACSSSSTPDLCSGVAAPCVAFPTGTAASTVTAAFNGTVAANTTFVFGSGTFAFDNTLNLPLVTGMKITGAGIDTTTLDFSGQTAGAGGIHAADGTQNITFSGFTVKNPKGDGIDVKSGVGVYFNKVKVIWTAADNTTHGSYALYPVNSTNVLIDGCVVIGSRDAGLYVGQSKTIIVRNSTVSQSVAGIEIEASSDADVYDNEAFNNTGGILVFALPGLSDPSGNHGTKNVRVYNNNVHDNNTLNFGAAGTTVAAVPAGSGILVIAATNVEVYGNNISNNDAVAFAFVSYCLLDLASSPNFCETLPNPIDPVFNPLGSSAWVHDNTFSGNGGSPHLTNAAGQVQLFGALLFQIKSAFPSSTISELLWDGIGGPGYAPPTGTATSGTPPNPLAYWQKNGASATFGNLNFQGGLVPDPANPVPDTTALRFDIADFTWPGTPTANPPGFPLPAVTVPGA